MIYLVKDYGRMKVLINDLADGLPNSRAVVSVNQHADPTLIKVIKIERLSEECRAVEWALEQIPAEYQKVIFNKICRDAAYPLCADPSTYSRWKCRFIYHIAEKLMYIWYKATLSEKKHIWAT